MTSNAQSGERIIGSLRSSNGKGVVRMEDRFDTDINDLWSAMTDPKRLARWWGRVEGDLRVGGEFALSSEWDGTGRVRACEPPNRFVVTIRESEESFRKGQGVPPFDSTIEAVLTAVGDDTLLVLEVAGMPVDKIEFYGVGWQIHLENLRVHVAGRERGDTEPRWAELLPAYRELAEQIR